MGLIPGLIYQSITNYKSGSSIFRAELFAALGVIVGMLFSSLLEIPLSGVDLNTALVGYFTPSALSNLINGLILLPILMVAYDAIASRSGR